MDVRFENLKTDISSACEKVANCYNEMEKRFIEYETVKEKIQLTMNESASKKTLEAAKKTLEAAINSWEQARTQRNTAEQEMYRYIR